MPARKRRDNEDEVESTASSLAILANWRTKGVRKSDEVVLRGQKILQEKGALRRMGDEVWPFLEQLGFAALDTGKTDLASICIERLSDKFPDSPRVDALQGLLLEATDSLDKAREFYETKLVKDENNVLVRKRLIALHLNNRSIQDPAAPLSVHKGIELLVDHLDTVYNDPEGWSQLADTYERLGMPQQSLACLSDLIILQPTNTFHVLRSAETHYTLGAYTTAYKTFCRALEMAGEMSEGKGAGLSRRAALGIKMCLRKIPSTSSAASGNGGGSKREVARAQENGTTGTDVPKKANDIDALVTEELMKAYTTSWQEPGDRIAGHEEAKALKLWLANTSLGSSTAAVKK